MHPMWAPWAGDAADGLLPWDDAEGCPICGLSSAADPQAALVVHRTAHSVVAVHRRPHLNGHLLVAPRAHVARLGDLPEEAAVDLMKVLQQTSQILNEIYRCDGLTVGGGEGEASGMWPADHFAWHLIPRWKGDVGFVPLLAGAGVVSAHLQATWKALAPCFVPLSEGQ